jgi:hypothetical protein
MYRIARAGVHAACLQTVLVVTVAFLTFMEGLIHITGDVSDVHFALALTDVLMAVCVSMLRTPATIESARYLATGFRRLSPRNPGRAAAALTSQLLLASFGFAAIALRSPPDWFQSLAMLLMGSGSGSIAWAGIMSVGTASFGAIAHATIYCGLR